MNQAQLNEKKPLLNVQTLAFTDLQVIFEEKNIFY